MNWKVFRDLKIEIILWTFSVLSMFNILYFLPTSTFSQMRDIFMGMNVELPQMTKIVMAFSSFVIHWKIIYLPVLVCCLIFIYWVGIKIMINILSSITDSDSNDYIKLQTKILAGLIFLFVIVQALSSLMSRAFTLPMLKLVNSI